MKVIENVLEIIKIVIKIDKNDIEMTTNSRTLSKIL